MTIVECGVADKGYSIGDCNVLQAIAVIECVGTNVVDAFRQIDCRQVGAVLERVIAYGFNGVRNTIVSESLWDGIDTTVVTVVYVIGTGINDFLVLEGYFDRRGTDDVVSQALSL